MKTRFLILLVVVCSLIILSSALLSNYIQIILKEAKNDIDSSYKIQQCPESISELTSRVFHCPAISAPTKMEVLQVDGFNICKNKNDDESYILKIGETGKILYTVYRGIDMNDPPAEPQYKEIIREPMFLQEINTEQMRSRLPFTPNGVHALYESDLVKLGFNQTATVGVTVTVDSNATEQSMWLGLPPFTCNGGAYVKFAIVE